MSEAEEQGKRVRPSIVDSIFFPGEKPALAEAVHDNLSKEGKRTGAAAVLCPHAAWQYAGSFMGTAFASAKKKGVKTVVILCPVHRDQTDGIFLSDSDYFVTPLGNIEVARDLVSELSVCSTKIYVDDIPHFEEHGIEVLIPFVQTLFPEARLVPILLGKATPALSEIAAKALSCVFAEKRDETLFVVSSSLSSNSEKAKSEKEARAFMELLERGDTEALLRAYQEGRVGACGTACAASLISFLGPVSAVSLCEPGSFSEGGKTVYYGAYGFFTE
jgi:AmmeMemoRadiSam system protein B